MIKDIYDKIKWGINHSSLQAGSIRKWIDGNYYQKQLGGSWRRFSSKEELSLRKYKERFTTWDSKRHREYMRELETNVELCILLPENVIVFIKDLHELFSLEKDGTDNGT